MKNITVSLKKDSTDGQTLCLAADEVGLNPEDLLLGACLNITRRAAAARGAAKQGQQPTPATQPELPLEPAQPAAVKPAGSAGMLAGVA